jgi:hypothetical protein
VIVATDIPNAAYDWTGTAASITVVLGFLGGCVAVLFRIFWRKVDRRLEAIDKKATPNGGHTLNLGDTAARTETKVDELRGMFQQHVMNHPGPGVPPTAALPAAPPLPRREEIAAGQTQGAAQ